MKTNEFPELPVEIINVVNPQTHPAINVVGCMEIEINGQFKDPDVKEKEAPYIYGHQLLERRLTESWQLATICWKRDDGHTNFGHEPAINHVLVAVLVKLKQ